MKAIKVMYLRKFIAFRNWSNTEQGERVFCTIGAIWAVLAFLSVSILLIGTLEPSMGLKRATTLVFAFYGIIWGICMMLREEDEQ